MTKKKGVDPDDAPELTEAFFDNAEHFHGDRFIRRGPGRPKTDAPKQQISVRLDQDVLAKLREAGPGWQSQVNVLLRPALRLEARAAYEIGRADARAEPRPPIGRLEAEIILLRSALLWMLKATTPEDSAAARANAIERVR